MTVTTPADIRDLHDQLDAAERDARALAGGLTEEEGAWRPRAGAWSVAECLDHLATANRVYLEAMTSAADRARRQGQVRRQPAKPGLIGRWFVWQFEPPPRSWAKMRAPRTIRPRTLPLAESLDRFLASQQQVREFLDEYWPLDLARIRFRNPFVRGIRLSLATGLHVITAHERRHLWQARRVSEALEREGRARSTSA